MDERYWWLATKVRESLWEKSKEGNITELETVFLEINNSNCINYFFDEDGPQYIYFAHSVDSASVEIHISSDIRDLSNKTLFPSDKVIVLLILKERNISISTTNFEEELFSIELKDHILQHLTSIFTHGFIPLLLAKYNSSANADKMNVLSTQLNASWQHVQNYTKHLYMERKPEEVIHSVLECCQESNDSVKYHEKFITDVMSEIEVVLEDVNERKSEQDMFLSSEMEKWQKRYQLLQNLISQLKGKMFKDSVGFLSAKKSKFIKKWRILESSITEAMNGSRDKMKYLESFKIECDIMERYAHQPNCLLLTIPKLFKKMKQKESFSRSFARSGMLGSLLSMIRRQIISMLENKIQLIIGYNVTQEELWLQIDQDLKETSSEVFLDMSWNQVKALLPQEDLSSNVESFNMILVNNGIKSNTILGVLKLSNLLHEMFWENLIVLRDALNVNNSLKCPGSIIDDSLAENNQSSGNENCQNGINLYDDNKIFSNWFIINGQTRKFIDIFDNILKLNRLLSLKSINVSAMKRDISNLLENDIIPWECHLERECHTENNVENAVSDVSDEEISMDENRWISVLMKSSQNYLQWLYLDDLLMMCIMRRSRIKITVDLNPDNATYVSLWDVLDKVKHLLTENVMSSFDIFELLSLDRLTFNESSQIAKTFSQHEEIMNKFDKTFCTFVDLVFLRSMTTNEALMVLTKFDHFKYRKTIKELLNHKMSDIFTHFKDDINGAYDSFKQFKERSTQCGRLFPVSSAVMWIQKLLLTIEKPMKKFQNLKEIVQMKEYPTVVKLYNKISKHLVTNQSVYVSHWLMLVDNCISIFKNHLLTIDFLNFKVSINLPKNMLVVINETRNMIRIQKHVSPSSLELVKCEKRIKTFHSKLEAAINYFESIKQSISPNVSFLFKNHIKSVLQTFQPGSSSLTWTTINIDVFLHKIMTVIANFESTVIQVTAMHNKFSDLLKVVEFSKMLDFNRLVEEEWSSGDFVTNVNKEVQINRQNIQRVLEKCQQIIEEIKQIIFHDENIDSSFPLYESEAIILDQLNEMFNKALTQALFRSIVNNLLYFAICTNCSKEDIHSLINLSGYNPLVEFSQHILVKDEENTFSRDDMKRISVFMMNSNLEEGKKLIKFVLSIKYEIPRIKLEPSIEIIKSIIEQLGQDIICFHKDVEDFSGKTIQSYYQLDSEVFYQFSQTIVNNISEMDVKVQNTIAKLNEFDFLWKMTTEQFSIEESLAGNDRCIRLKDKMQQVLTLKNSLQQLPKQIVIDCLVISTNIFKNVLFSLLNHWQNKYGQSLHEEAKRLLDEATHYREGIAAELNQDVIELEQLNELLSILDQIFDLDLKIDSVYQPIELMYADLETFDLPILRSEESELNQLRKYWEILIKMAEDQRNRLLKEKRNIFRQELDKQLKKITVEVIQFRNYFDFECLRMVGSDPVEVERKLEHFRNQYSIFEEKRNTLVSISKLFGLKVQSFHELESMKEDLLLLTQLYSLYQRYSEFERNLNDELWSKVDLDDAFIKLTEFWDECLALPYKLKENESYVELKGKIDYFIKIHSILVKLASKEIKNRHWIQVMEVTRTNFQLEADAFRCSSLTVIRLLEHKKKIDRICYNAKKEMEIQIKLGQIEEEWTEQVLVFKMHSRKGPVILEINFTNSLLLQLEDSQIFLTKMFKSPHIQPMKDEAAQWAAKLMEMSEVLELWLEVQELWLDLENMFTNPVIMDELPQECKRFERLDISYVKSMQRVYDTKNVFQCCISNEYSKKSFLKNIQQGLETCFESLRGYLHQKRNLLPRLWFVPDVAILSIMNCDGNHADIKEHLPMMFTAVSDIHLNQLPKEEIIQIDKVFSASGEEIVLHNKVTVKDEVIDWMSILCLEIEKSISGLTNEAIKYLTLNGSLEELPKKFPTQICYSALHLYWTNEIRTAMAEIKSDKKSLSHLSKRFNTQISKIPLALNSCKIADDPVTELQRKRLRSLTLGGLYLRDCLGNLSSRKIKEWDDFEWQKIIKMNATEPDKSGSQKFQLNALTSSHLLGLEFQGSLPCISWTPLTDKYLLSLMTNLEHQKMSTLFGVSQSGKSALISELARLTNRFHVVKHCQPNMSPKSLIDFMCGLATNGCWGVLDNFEHVDETRLTMVWMMIGQINEALKQRSTVVKLAFKNEITLKSDINLFLTSCLGNEDFEKLIPGNIRGEFRILSIIVPDQLQLIRWYCVYFNFRHSQTLALRLHVVMKQFNALSDQKGQFTINMKSIVSVLKMASTKEKLLFSKEKSNSAESGQMSRGSTSVDFLSPFVERKIKSPIPSFNKQKPNEMATSLSLPAKHEHNLVLESLIELVLPSIIPENEHIIREILKDTFQSFADLHNKNMKCTIPQELTTAIMMEGKLRKCSMTGALMEKIIQLYNVARINQAVIICGSTLTGKSTSLEILLSSMNFVYEKKHSDKHHSNQSTDKLWNEPLLNQKHHLYTIYPVIFENENDLFGNWSANQERKFQDGLLTFLWKKANRNELMSWISFDCPTVSEWSHALHTVLDDSHSLFLPDGQRLPQTKSTKFVFEMNSLKDISPGVMSRSGMVYFSSNSVRWKELRMSCLEDKSSLKKTALTKIFDQIMDPILQHVIQNYREDNANSLTIAFQNSMQVLSQMLVDNKEILTELHIQRLFVFSFMWSLNNQIPNLKKIEMTELLKKETVILPDDDSNICIFDYYVDETGEWDLWSSLLTGEINTENLNLTGEIIVDTASTVRCKLFLDIITRASLNAVLIGARGSGKSLILDSHLRKSDSSAMNVHRFVYSYFTKSNELKSFIEANMEHRQGFMYSGKENKHLTIVIEDLNLPKSLDKDSNNICRPNEILRQLLNLNVIQNSKYPFEQMKLLGYNIIGTVGALNNSRSIPSELVDSRLMRHFIPIQMEPWEDCDLNGIIRGIFEGHMITVANRHFPTDELNKLIVATQKLYGKVSSVLYRSLSENRSHLDFQLKNINDFASGMSLFKCDQMSSESILLQYWSYLAKRIFQDCLVWEPDLKWFNTTLETVIQDVWLKETSLESSILERNFISFSPEEGISQSVPEIDDSSLSKCSTILPLDDLDSARLFFISQINQFNETVSKFKINLPLTNNVLVQVMNIHRHITKPFNGHAIVVGNVGTHLSQLCCLALQIAKIPIHRLDNFSDVRFIDSMKSIMRQVGSEGKKAAVLLTSRSLNSSLILSSMNSLMISGECPRFFSPDEMNGLLSALSLSIKRERSSKIVLTNSDLMEQFRSRIRRDLHIVLCVSPKSDLLWESLDKYPGILSRAVVNWIKDSEESYISSDSNYFVKNFITEKNQCLVKEKDNDQLIQYMTQLHLEALKQFSFKSTEMGKSIKIGKVFVNEKKNEIYKYDSVPIAPYSQLLLRDKLRIYCNGSIPPENIYYGPCTFQRFLDIFKRLIKQKSFEKYQSTQKFRRALESIRQTDNDIKTINNLISHQKQKLEEISKNSQNLLKKLIQKITLLRMILAKQEDHGYLNVMLLKNFSLNTLTIEKSTLLVENEKDDLDLEFERIHEDSLKNRKNILIEALEKGRKEYNGLKKDLAYARSQVEFWKSKIDRHVMDRIKSFQNPPVLVIDIIQMVFTLIGKQIHNSRRDSNPEEMFTDEKSNTKALWNQMQNFMTDTQKFVEILHNVSWTDGLDKEVYNGVKSYLATSKDSKSGVTGEGTLLDQAENVNIKTKKPKQIVVPNVAEDDLPSLKGISISASKYTSEDAVLLVQYTIALMEYTDKCEPLNQAIGKIREMEIELEDMDSVADHVNETEDDNTDYLTLNMSEEELNNLKVECDQLGTEYNGIIGDRFRVEMELKALLERLSLNEWMINNIKPFEEEWQDCLAKYQDDQTMFIQCLLSSAYLTYCGPLTFNQRKEFFDFGVTLAKNLDLISSKYSCTNIDLIRFLHDDLTISKLETNNLPCCEDELDNAYFIITESLLLNWILISDPTRRAISWLENYLVQYSPVVLESCDILEKLEGCLSSGQCVILTDCNVNNLLNDEILLQLFKNQYRFSTEVKPFKLILDSGREIECDPRFRLFLHTCSLPNQFSDVLFYLTFVISFNVSRQILTHEYLSRFSEKMKPAIDAEHKKHLHEREKIQVDLIKLKEQILNDLSNGIRNIKNTENCKKIINHLKIYEEIKTGLVQKQFLISSHKKAMENYYPIAARCATILQMASNMKKVERHYFINFDKYLMLFESIIESCDRLSNKSIIDKLTKKTIKYSLLSMNDENKFIFCLILALEIYKSANCVEPYLEHFLISPLAASLKCNPDFVKQNESRSSNSKKPFDWMTEENLMNIKILGTCFPCFKDILENMYKDSKGNQWKILFDGESPESSSLLEKLFKVSLDPFQKLCLIRAVRPDKFMQASYLFVQSQLNLNFKGIVSASDINLALLATGSRSAIILRYLNNSQETELFFNQLKTANKINFLHFKLNDYTKEGKISFFHHLQTELSNVHDSHNSASMASSAVLEPDSVFIIIHTTSTAHISGIHSQVSSIIERLNSLNNRKHLSKSKHQITFNLFYTSHISETISDNTELQNMTMISLDYPKNVRDMFINLFQTGYLYDSKNSKISSDFLPTVHNCSLLLSVLKYRCSYASLGFHESQVISATSNSTNLYEIIEKLSTGCDASNHGILWNNLRFFVCEIIYGRITSESDRSSLISIVDFWLNLNAIRREFEFPKLKYHCPAILYSKNPKLVDIKKAFLGISPMLFENTEAAHLSTNLLLKSNAESVFINKLDKMEKTIKLSRTVQYQIDISKVELDLFDIMKNLLSKLPKSTLESVQDKMKKVNNPPVYSKILMRELTRYYGLFEEIIGLNQKIRDIIMNTMTLTFDKENVDGIWSLLNNEIPMKWRKKLLNCNQNYELPIAEWLTSLTTKYQHIEKLILTSKEKVSCFWLGSFQKPISFLSYFKEELLAQFMRSDKSGSFKEIRLLVELTNKDRDHVKEPPSDGILINGLYIWGCGFDNSTNDLTDTGLKGTCTALPVAHITFSLMDQERSENVDQYNCPVFMDSLSRQSPILFVTISKEGFSSSKWTLRGVFITLNPF